MRTRIYYYLWLHVPIWSVKDYCWQKWLDAQWLKPAPHVEPRHRRIDLPTQDTGVDDPRLR